MSEFFDLLEDLLMKYRNKFGEDFPLYFASMPDDELISTIKKCLETGEPYVFEYEEGAIY